MDKWNIKKKFENREIKKSQIQMINIVIKNC